MSDYSKEAIRLVRGAKPPTNCACSKSSECMFHHRAKKRVEQALKKVEERGRREASKVTHSADDDFKFEYRSASGSCTRHTINRALLSGSDFDLVRVFHAVADNAFQLGRKEAQALVKKIEGKK